MVPAAQIVPEPIAADEPTSPAAVEAILDYVAAPLFRSARIEELVIEDNPYRRPVRPEDLEWLRFDEPIGPDTAAELSALLGHRMLLSIYDSERRLLPAQMTDEKWRDFDEFYSPATRARGERIRQLLERHLFHYVWRAAVDGEPDRAIEPNAVHKILLSVAEQCDRQAQELHRIESEAENPARICRMLTIQLVGQRISAPLRLTASLVAQCLDNKGQPVTADAAKDCSARVDPAVSDLARQHNLGWQAHRYFQFYLPTTLSLMNYLSYCGREPADVFRFVGAMAARTLMSESLIDWRTDVNPGKSRAATGARGSAVERTLCWLQDYVIDEIWPRYGARSLREFVTGVLEYATLVDAHHKDLTSQLLWLDAGRMYQEKARRLQSAITEHNIPVELDTFVESWEECSTAHVHDDDRLVVIESGEMEFWNCFGEMHKFGPGDAMYVPMHRLHGSVVMSGTCVYHQPVITPEINGQYG